MVHATAVMIAEAVGSTPPGPKAGTLPHVADDAQSFALLYAEQYGRLVRALEIAGARPAEAEDAAQEAFARTLVHWRRVQRGENSAGYVFRTAFRLLNRDWTRHARSDESVDTDKVAVAGSESSVVERVDLHAALAAMSDRQRTCVGLCLYLGMSAEEAGAVLGLDAATVRVHIHRARAKLKDALL